MHQAAVLTCELFYLAALTLLPDQVYRSHRCGGGSQAALARPCCAMAWAPTAPPPRPPVRCCFRVWLLGAARISTALVPSQRSASEGTAMLLHRAAREGWAGLLVDWLRIAAGERRTACHAWRPLPGIALQPGVGRALPPTQQQLAPCPLPTGTRLLVHTGCACLVRMPPLTLLVQQTALMLLTANPSGYCR